MTWYDYILTFQVHQHDSHPNDHFIMNVADTLCEGHRSGATIPVGLWTIFCVIKYFPTTSAIGRGPGPDTIKQHKVDKEGELYSSFHIIKGHSYIIFSHIFNVWLENF